MTVANLPKGSKTARFLRALKFVFRPIKYVEDYMKVYGDTFTIFNQNGNHIIYFSHPQALEEIFTAEESYFEGGQGNPILRLLLGDNSLINLDGSRHSAQRQLLAPPFHGDKMRAYGEIIREITEEVMNEWQVGKAFNIRGSMQKISLRVILRVVFGLDEGQRLEELQQTMSSLMEFINSPLMSSSFFFRFLQRDFGAWSPWGRVKLKIAKMDELVYGLIADRRSENNIFRQDILSLMMAARYDDGQRMSDVELRDELITLLLAGHETTASALTWSFYWLDHLPEIREKLLTELNSLGYNWQPTDAAKLPYLTAICQETLRIYPIAMASFLRIVKKTIEIMGYSLAPGTRIVPSIYIAHHREETYPQSKQFKPERFIERQFSPYEYFPFGGGNRRCIGLAFAMYEMKIVLATITSQMQLELVNKNPVQPVRRGLTVATPAGMKMVAKPIVKGV